MEFFTQKHFDLLEKWQGKQSENNNFEQDEAKKELKEAYEAIELWANGLKNTFCPDGYVKLRKSPINQGGNFFDYLWAKIYPNKNSPTELAYTVHITPEGFAVKIDTINVKAKLRKKYEEVRGEYSTSPIVKTMTLAEFPSIVEPSIGRIFPVEGLIKWSKKELDNLGMSYQNVVDALGLNKTSSTNENKIPGEGNEMNSEKLSLNTILYGPPGTGKTYHTVQASVKAAEPSFKAKSRADLKKKYDELVAEKRIRFVTFHQSYGYEEFVEGLRANSDQGQVSYDVEPGIFKQICEQASQGVDPESDPLEQALEKFKEKLEEDGEIKFETLRGHDFSVQYHGNTTFRVFPKASVHDDLGRGYPVSIENIKKLYRGVNTKKIYNSSYAKSILNFLKHEYGVKDFTVPTSGQIKNFVLIIDEINRGNVSKIFGELITLIEDTKRSGEGQDEALEVVLPNSGDPFTVPNNLYLIGTMNTADRSLAMMDTALRRRFDFVEMMPKPELFNDITVNGIDLEELIRKMNQRIEVLYDREHTLGHAFFMPVKALVKDQDKAFNELKLVLKNKIIPLLEEYFFEDWNKIRLVLGDNQKAEDLQYVSEEKQSFDSLFGNDHGLNSYQQEEKSYKLLPFDNDVWNKPEAYIGIYKATKED
jgi:5-methylcytosine-specific restriction protein B